jgi:2-polyprenyl-3-methyl-5-hydroxy-6-metoxy-1,4-benzoquinol methylase
MGDETEIMQTSHTESCEDPMRWETVPCDLCTSLETEFRLSGVDWEHGLTGPFSLVKCSRCGLTYLNPRPSPESIKMAYPANYQFYARTGTVKRILRKIYGTWRARYPYLDGLPVGSILDVGCATGETVYLFGQNGSLMQLKNKGWKVFGIDIDEAAVKAAQSNGISAHVGRLEEAGQLGIDFDVIRFHHVLEHSFSPRSDLLKAAKLLKPNGRIIISGPNIESAAFHLFQKYWSGLDLPRHLYHFTPKSLGVLCDSASLTVLNVYFDGRSTEFVHSMKHFLQSAEVTRANGTCQRGEHDLKETPELFPRFSRVSFSIAMKLVVRLLNKARQGDNFTVIAGHRVQ